MEDSFKSGGSGRTKVDSDRRYRGKKGVKREGITLRGVSKSVERGRFKGGAHQVSNKTFTTEMDSQQFPDSFSQPLSELSLGWDVAWAE